MFLIGQRVLIYGSVIGTVVKPENSSITTGVWVFNPEKGYASCYAECNISALPNGQL